MVKEMESVKLSASSREEVGSGPVNRLRQQGWLPCVVYNAQGQSRPLKVNRHHFELLLRHHGAQNLILDLDIEGGTARKVLLKEIQRDRIKDHTIHADFLEISMTRKLRVPVAITLVGEPVGVTQQGGVLEHLLRTVEVECLPTHIVKEFTLDVSALNIGDSLFVRDLKIDPTLTLLTPGDITIASVQLPHVEEEVKPEAAAAEAAQEPEVIGKEEKEAEEGEEAKGKEGKEAKEKTPEDKGKAKEPSKAKEPKEKPSEPKEKGKEGKEKAKAK